MLFLKSISEQDLVNVVPRTQKSRFGFVKKPGELAGMNLYFNLSFFFIIFLAVREDAQHISPAKPVASSRVSGAWKKVCPIIKNLIFVI